MTSSTPLLAFLGFFQDAAAPAQHAAGGEAALVLPNLNQAMFLGGIGGRALLLWGLVVCALGLLFGLAQYTQLRNLPVHRSMREISELISVELLLMLLILLFIPGDYAGPCFIGFAIGESLGAAALRVAGGIFTKIADIGADLMKIVFKIKEDDARNPGVIADCTGDNAGDSVGPSADGFETYGVTGVALISFILLGVRSETIQVQLLVWIFVMRIMMLVASAISYFLNEAIAKAKYATSEEMNFETPLTSLVWLTSFVSIALTFLVSKLIIPD